MRVWNAIARWLGLQEVRAMVLRVMVERMVEKWKSFRREGGRERMNKVHLPWCMGFLSWCSGRGMEGFMVEERRTREGGSSCHGVWIFFMCPCEWA